MPWCKNYSILWLHNNNTFCIYLLSIVVDRQENMNSIGATMC